MKMKTGDIHSMKTVLIKTLLLYALCMLTACSLITDNDSITSNTRKKPVIVENAQESINRNYNQPPAPRTEPRDQNTLQAVSLGSTPASSEPVGGSIEKSMDQDDKIKMSRALDKAPGKTTSWTNNRTGIHYEVTPIRKIVIKNNPYCRVYQTISTRGSFSKEVSGTACISEDGNWHPM